MKSTHSVIVALIAGLFALPAVAQTPAPANPAKDAIKADRANLKADRKEIKEDRAAIKADRAQLKAERAAF